MSNEAPATTPPADRKVPVTMTISQGLLDRIDSAASADLRTRSNYIEAKFTEFFAAPETETHNTSEPASPTHREPIVDRVR